LGPFANWFATGVAFVVSVFCSVAEGALLSFSLSRLEERLKDPQARKRVEGHLARIDRYLFSAIVLNAISDVVLVFACTLGFIPHGPAYALVISLVVVILGAEVLPRAFAAFYAEALLPHVLPPIAVADALLLPIVWPLRKVHQAIERALAGGGDERERRAAEIVDEIRSATLEGSREGVLDAADAEMIESIIEFRDVEVREIMTPRTDMIAIEVSTPVSDAVKIAVEKGHSRIPVFEGTRDRMVGVLYAKDLLRVLGDGAQKAGVSMRSLLRKPLYVPVTKQVGELLKEFRTRQVHIAIVLDEYGGTAGMVTIEDVIEVIIGEIEDEYAEGREEAPPFRRIDAQTAEVDARLRIEEANEKLGLDLPEQAEFETIGGFLSYQLGKIPKKGEKLAQGEVEYTVVEADERRIKRVRVTKQRVAEAQP
jgi:CBS domain containing-hemolysin-like protein